MSPTDILKADIIGEIGGSVQGRYTDLWEQLEEELGRDDFRDLFAHIRMVYMETKSRGTLNQEFRKGVMEEVRMKSEDFIDKKLRPYAEAYEIVSKAAYESAGDATRINTYLRYLQRLDNHDWIPPAMEFLRLHHRSDADAVAEFVCNLERLAYALFIQRANVNVRIDRYAKVLRAVKERKPVAEMEALQLSDSEKKEGLRLAHHSSIDTG